MHQLTIRKHLKLNHSILWLKCAFITFREKPIQFFILEVFVSFLTLLPFLGAFLGPLLVARFMDCANKTEKYHNLQMRDIFTGFFANKTLVRLAFLNFVLNAMILLIQYFIEGSAVGSSIIKPTLLTLILTIPTIILTISMWVSPAICLFHDDIEPKHAMWISLKMTFHNVLVLLAFSIIVAGVSLILGLPIFYLLVSFWSNTHNLFIMIPVSVIVYIICMVWFAILNITSYFVYKNIVIA